MSRNRNFQNRTGSAENDPFSRDASRSGASEFERGRKASRDYDSNYTGYRPASEFGSYNEYGNGYGGNYGNQGSDDWRSSSYGRPQPYEGSDFGYSQSGATGKGPKGWKRTDERIYEDVCHRLEQDHVVDASHIEVKVQDGLVTLSGHIATRPIKRRAEDIIESIAGVRDVRNELTVDQSLFQQAKDFVMGEASDSKSRSMSGDGGARH